MNIEEYEKHCYLLGRYLEYEKEENTFQEKSESLINEGLKFRSSNTGIHVLENENKITTIDAIDFLMHMVARDHIYDLEDKKLCPILLYKGDSICYGVLNEFIHNIAESLDKKGYIVEIYDLSANNTNNVNKLLYKHFKAIIGIQTEAFSIQIQNGKNLHDLIYGPKMMIALDHPGTMYKIITKAPKNFYMITHDTYYKNYIEKFFPNVLDTFIIPPGGRSSKDLMNSNANKDIPFSFVGSYYDYRLLLPMLADFNNANDNLGTEFILEAEKNPEWPLEEILQNVINHRIENGMMQKPSNTEFARIFSTLQIPINIVMNKNREKILLAILKSGLELHVYGDSWKNTKVFDKFTNLMIHPALTPEESYNVYARSKVSLNIMSYHKAGMTERLANMMLNHTVIVTDESEYLNHNYQNDEDMIIFHLDEESINNLPNRIHDMITDDHKRVLMAESAYHKALQKETWDIRTNELINAIVSMND